MLGRVPHGLDALVPTLGAAAPPGVMVSISSPSARASPCRWKCVSRSPGARVARAPTMKRRRASSRALRLMDFFGQRLKAFWSAQGVETLVLDAAMAPGFDDISDTRQRVQALAEFSRAEDFEALALTLKRA